MASSRLRCGPQAYENSESQSDGADGAAVVGVSGIGYANANGVGAVHARPRARMACPYRIYHFPCEAVLVTVLLLFCAALPCPASLAAEVTVRLFQAHAPVSSMIVWGPFSVIAPERADVGDKAIEVAAVSGEVCLRHKRSRRPVVRLAQHCVLRPVGASILRVQHSAKVIRSYCGELQFSVDKNDKLVVRNKLSTRDYVVSVVGSETYPQWPAEALKAQAVLTQTRLARQNLRQDLVDSTQQEVYLGMASARPPVADAVKAVWGKVVTHDGRPATIFYHAACSGGTSGGAFMLGAKSSSYPYLKARPCNFCRQSPFWKELASLVPAAIFRRVAEDLPVVIKSDEAGRPLKVSVGASGETSGYGLWIKIGQVLGWDKVPGTRYSISRQGNAIRLVSRGAGHGVGMCQWGAAGMAASGKRYQEILQYYFPGTMVSTWR